MSETGRIVARHRNHAEVESLAGDHLVCIARQRRMSMLIGDHVTFSRVDEGGVIDSVAERRSVLTRVNKRGERQEIAANLTQLVIVIAPEPAVDWLVLDHYLVAATLNHLAPLVVFNKADLPQGPPPELADYAAFTPMIHTSIQDLASIGQLAEHLAHQASVLVGQSGVGKSSLINALLGDSVQSVGELSIKLRQGRHTTTAAMLYQLPGGGELIDSPGVRQYAPYIDHEREVANGFMEMHELVRQCKFDNCAHLAEPGCAVKAAVDSGALMARRYESYTKLYALVSELRQRRQP